MTGSSNGVSVWSVRSMVRTTSQEGGAWRPEREAWNWWARQTAWVISSSPSWKMEPPSTASLVANETLGIRSTSGVELVWPELAAPDFWDLPCSEGMFAASQPNLSVVLVLGSVKDLFKCNGYSSAWARSSVITAFRESLGLLAMQ